MNVTLVLSGIAVLLVIITVAYVVTKQEPTEATEVTTGFIEQYMASKNPILIDIRTAEEFQSGHIPGSINRDFYSPDFVERILKVTEGKEVFLYCRSGSRSGQAQALLSQKGLKINHLQGGIGSYQGVLER